MSIAVEIQKLDGGDSYEPNALDTLTITDSHFTMDDWRCSTTLYPCEAKSVCSVNLRYRPRLGLLSRLS